MRHVIHMLFIMIGRYGVESVKKWKFETWNEPDLKGYNLLNFTVEGAANKAFNDQLNESFFCRIRRIHQWN